MSDTPEDWTDEQNAMFVKLYKFMVRSQAAIRHPDSPEVPAEQWQTICHNAAWSAAEFVDADDLTIIDADTEQVLAHSPKGLNS